MYYSCRFELHIFDHLIENHHPQQRMSWNLEVEHGEVYDSISSQNSVIANSAVVYQADKQESDGSVGTSYYGYACDGVSCDLENSHDSQVQEITFD